MSLGTFVWYEAVTNNPEKTVNFYTKLFGWETQPFGEGEQSYTMFAVQGRPIGGVTPLPEGLAVPPHWISCLHVENVDEGVTLNTSKGGKTLIPPATMPTVGRMATIADPQGAMVMLYTPEEASPPKPKGVTFDFCWNELYVESVEKALAFYGKLAGWEVVPYDMGPMGVYHVVKKGEHMLGGIMAFPPNAPKIPMWIPYVEVADTDETLSKTSELGGETIWGPVDMVSVGRMAMIKDPLGAVLSVIKSAPMPE